MKKAILAVALSLCFLAGFSQDDQLLKNKKGKLILPQKGDFALGISANPFFDYAGNLLNGSGYNSLILSLLNGNQLYGKYFIDAQSALRVKFMVYQNNSHYENNVSDDVNSGKLVTDKLDQKASNMNFTVGYEKRRGTGRIQVVYGGEVNFKLSSYKNSYSYGNKFSPTNTYPTTTINFGGNYSTRVSGRVLQNEQGTGVGLGARVFAGIEYFVFPKISVGGEMGLGYDKGFSVARKNTDESWDFTTNAVSVTDIDNTYSTSGLNTEIMGGQIAVLFHF